MFQRLSNFAILAFSESMSNETENKFWQCPELVENLLPFLDTYSIICLAKAHKTTQDIVLGKTVWNMLIRQVCRANKRMYSSYHPDDFDLEKEFTQMKIQVTCILDLWSTQVWQCQESESACYCHPSRNS